MIYVIVSVNILVTFNKVIIIIIITVSYYYYYCERLKFSNQFLEIYMAPDGIYCNFCTFKDLLLKGIWLIICCEIVIYSVESSLVPRHPPRPLRAWLLSASGDKAK